METRYVVGFAFPRRDDQKTVLLIRKAKPEWQKGKFNGVGGKIEPGEKAVEAMAREFTEETGIPTVPANWRWFADIVGSDYTVACFVWEAMPYSNWRTVNPEEPVQSVRLVDLPYMTDVLYNLKYLIPMSLDPRLLPPKLIDKPGAKF